MKARRISEGCNPWRTHSCVLCRDSARHLQLLKYPGGMRRDESRRGTHECVRHVLFLVLLFLFVGLSGWAQEQAQLPPPPEEKKAAQEPVEPERWNLFYQATSIGQYHGTFHSSYSGPFSLQNYLERDVSLTTTLFFGLRLEKNTTLYFDPEIAGGKGFSNVNGLANASNGELPRVASATPKPYIARLYI